MDVATEFSRFPIHPVADGRINVVGATHLVFASDRTYTLERSERAATAIINSADHLSTETRAAIGWQNAQRPLPRLAG